jgi:hypothetical protein
MLKDEERVNLTEAAWKARWSNPVQRFWARVNKNGPTPVHRPDLGPCWVWTGPTRRGYARISIDGRRASVHKFAWEFVHGPMPDGLVPDHLCRNRACVRESHIEPVTSVENVLRGNGLSATNLRKTHCIHGHEFTKENTVFSRKRSTLGRVRICRKCRNRRVLIYYHALPVGKQHPKKP